MRVTRLIRRHPLSRRDSLRGLKSSVIYHENREDICEIISYTKQVTRVRRYIEM